MGVYETLFKFVDATSKYMGDPGNHPWAQGYPLTTQLPGGPPLPDQINLDYTDLKYPKATGEIGLREAITNYYNNHYSAGITPDHVAVFADVTDAKQIEQLVAQTPKRFGQIDILVNNAG